MATPFMPDVLLVYICSVVLKWARSPELRGPWRATHDVMDEKQNTSTFYDSLQLFDQHFLLPFFPLSLSLFMFLAFSRWTVCEAHWWAFLDGHNRHPGRQRTAEEIAWRNSQTALSIGCRKMENVSRKINMNQLVLVLLCLVTVETNCDPLMNSHQNDRIILLRHERAKRAIVSKCTRWSIW